MGIVGRHPESGVRVEVDRQGDGPPWTYAGHAVTPTERFAVRAAVSGAGEVTVELDPGAPAGLAQRIRLILRAACKHARDDAAPPPRRIVRWRDDR